MSISVCKRIQKNPRGAGDIGDIGDIFRKSLKLLDFLNISDGDISGDIFGDGDKSPPAPARADRSISEMETVQKSMTAIAGFITVRPSRKKKH